MLNFLQQGSQYGTWSANEFRLVTAIGWVVEAMNGLLKTRKLLSEVFPITQIPYIGDYDLKRHHKRMKSSRRECLLK